jgi:hypothetical protein
MPDRHETFQYDYSQLYIYDSTREWSPQRTEYLEALDDANQAGLSVGARHGVVDVLMPRQENFTASLLIRVLSSSPPVRADADHIVDFDLLLPSGRVTLEGSGGAGVFEVTLAPDSYRARLTGERFDDAAAWSYDDPGPPPDSYTLELWPCAERRPPSELKRWPGYDTRA